MTITPKVPGINDRSAAARAVAQEAHSKTADQAAAAVLSLENVSQKLTALEQKVKELEAELAEFRASGKHNSEASEKEEKASPSSPSAAADGEEEAQHG